MSLNNVQIKLFTLSLRSALPHSGICPVEIVTIDMRCYISEVPVKNVDKQIGRKAMQGRLIFLEGRRCFELIESDWTELYWECRSLRLV